MTVAGDAGLGSVSVGVEAGAAAADEAVGASAAPLELQRPLDGGGVLGGRSRQGLPDGNGGRCGHASDHEHAHDERQAVE